MMKPTIFCGVPRVYDRIYTGLMQTKNNFSILNFKCTAFLVVICGSH